MSNRFELVINQKLSVEENLHNFQDAVLNNSYSFLEEEKEQIISYFLSNWEHDIVCAPQDFWCAFSYPSHGKQIDAIERFNSYKIIIEKIGVEKEIAIFKSECSVDDFASELKQIELLNKYSYYRNSSVFKDAFVNNNFFIKTRKYEGYERYFDLVIKLVITTNYEVEFLNYIFENFSKNEYEVIKIKIEEVQSKFNRVQEEFNRHNHYMTGPDIDMLHEKNTSKEKQEKICDTHEDGA